MKAGKQLSPAELERYSRQLALPGFGEEGQLRLRQGSVLVVGAGGLGAPLLIYLAAAGVGRIGIVDDDRVALSNLHRQILYSEEDLGQAKAGVAARQLGRINPHTEIEVHPVRLTAANATDILGSYDVIADGTDNFATRYLVNDACVLLGKANVYASIYRYEGQVAVFNCPRADGTFGPHYRDLYPEPPPSGMVPDCATGGVLGVLAGIIGSLQANEVIKLLSGCGEPLDSRLFVIDTRDLSTRLVRLPRHSSHPIEQLDDYEAFCQAGHPDGVKEISAGRLHQWVKKNTDFQLIDVRTPLEHRLSSIGGRLIPLEDILERADEIDRHRPAVLYCQAGERSRVAIRQLERQYGFDNLYNLQGGLQAWHQAQRERE